MGRIRKKLLVLVIMMSAVMGGVIGCGDTGAKNINMEEGAVSELTADAETVVEEIDALQEGFSENSEREKTYVTNDDANIEVSIEERERIFTDIFSNTALNDEERAYQLIINGFYDSAVALLESPSVEIGSKGWINLGYIYANGLTDKEVSIQMIEECYDKANCLEAEYNRLYLYLEYQLEGGQEMLSDFLNKDDEVVKEFLCECVPTIDHFEGEKIFDNEGGEISREQLFEYLYDWSATNEYATGSSADIPYDTVTTRWIPQSIDDEGGHYCATYRKYEKNICKGKDKLEKIY